MSSRKVAEALEKKLTILLVKMHLMNADKMSDWSAKKDVLRRIMYSNANKGQYKT